MVSPPASRIAALVAVIALAASGCTNAAASDDYRATAYDQRVLADAPLAYLPMAAQGASEHDLTGRGHDGTYQGTRVTTTTAPDGSPVAVFNGSDAALSVASASGLSIPTTGQLTWEAWLRPSTLQFPTSTNGYVQWLGKCEQRTTDCEWAARLYDATNSQARCSRLSAYVFNPSGGLGSGAYWQPECGASDTTRWLHVVGSYDLRSTPSGCDATTPGEVTIWVNGVRWNASAHRPTGCLSQYGVRPAAGPSAVLIGTLSRDSWYAGAIGKVAFYDHLLTDDQVAAHYEAMTGRRPSGTCGVNSCTFGG